MDNKNNKTLNSTDISENNSEVKGRFALQKKNYLLIIVGFAMMITGFVLMSGGGSDDPAVFSEELFSFRRITLAPIIILLGIVIEIIAIMWIPKKR